MSGERWWLMRTSALGDVVLASAAVRTLRAARPHADVTLLTRRAWAPLLAWCPGVARVLTLEEDAEDGTLAGLRALARRHAAPDVFVDLQGGVRGRVLAAAWGVPRHRAESDGIARRLMIRGPRTGLPGRYWPARPVRPAWEKMARTVARALARPEAEVLPPFLDPPEVSRAAARELWRAAPGACRIAICEGARGAKRWPAGHVQALADLLAGEAQVAILSDDGPDPVAPTRLERPRGGVTVRAALPAAAAFLAEADVVVAGDTGLAHVAAACGARVVSLFGPTVPALGFAPAGPGHRILERSLACRPCSVHGTRACWRGDHACLAGLGPDLVAAAVRQAIAAGHVVRG